MSKIFETDKEIVELVREKFEDTGLAHQGINLKVMSLTKANQLVKVSKASATTEFLAKTSDCIQMFIYEEAFDMLNDRDKSLIIEGALSIVSYDTEKEKIIIDNTPFAELFNMRKKYGNAYTDLLESTFELIKSIEEKKKEEKKNNKE